MQAHFPELVFVAAIAALVIIGGRARARNPATKLEGTPRLSKKDGIRYAIGFALIAAIAGVSLLTRH